MSLVIPGMDAERRRWRPQRADAVRVAAVPLDAAKSLSVLKIVTFGRLARERSTFLDDD